MIRGSRITYPITPPPPLPSKMIHDFPDHLCRHVIHPFVIKKNDPTRSNNNIEWKHKAPHFGSYFFHTNWWIISFLELTFVDQFFPHKLVDHFFFGTYIWITFFFHTNWWIISFLELTFLDLFFSHKLVDP